MKFRPLSKQVLVEPRQKQNKVGGIFLPDQGQQESGEAVVMAIGKEVTEVGVGDVVAISRYAGQLIKLENKEYRLFRESDILGVIG